MLPPKSGEVRQLVVLLHGYGSDGNDLLGLAPMWADHMPDALFIAPNGVAPCDINPMGYQWFALALERDFSRLDAQPEARVAINQFLQVLWDDTGLGPAQTILVGFSQGAMMAIDVGLRHEETLLGVIGFSGALLAPANLQSEIKSKPPVCLVHGAADEVVPVAATEQAADILQALEVRVAKQIEPGNGHGISVEGIGFALAFLRELGAEKREAPNG